MGGDPRPRAPVANTSAFAGRDRPLRLPRPRRALVTTGSPASDEMSPLVDEAVDRHLVVPGVRRLVCAYALRHRSPVWGDDGTHAGHPARVCRRPSASRSAARTIIFEGMQPQYGHSPPTSSASIPTTLRPASARLPATSSPPGPKPTTTASQSTGLKVAPVGDLHRFHDRAYPR